MAAAYEETLQALAAQPDGSAQTAAGKLCAAILSAGALVVAEHARKRPTAESYPAFQRVRVLERGDAALSFYRVRLPGNDEVSR
jgi:hypothetical protein